MSEALLSDLSQQLATLLAQGNYAAGFALGRHILRAYPRHLVTYKQMGLAARDAGLLSDSVDLLQRALSANPEDAEMWLALQDVTTQLDLYTDAAVAAAYVADLTAAEAGETPIARGHAAARQHAWEEAYQAYRQGFLAHPQRMDAGLGLMSALYQLGQWQAALDVARHILVELPYSLKALWGVIACTLAQPDEGLSIKPYFRTARSLDPDDGYAQLWFDDLPETLFDHPPATLPAWDTAELWQHLHNAE